MAQANDSILVTPGSGATVATHSPGDGKEYQVIMPAGPNGHILGSKPGYVLWIPGVAVGASKLFFDLFNAAGSGKIIELLGIWAIPKQDVAVTGALGVEVGLYRTSAVGTGGTAATYNTGSALTAANITPKDTANAALPAQITARTSPTAGATIAAPYWGQYIQTEESPTSMAALQAFMNLLPIGMEEFQSITLNEGQGLLVKQGTVAGVGSIAFLVDFALR